MSVNELKIGDRIKYYTTTGLIKEGVILDIKGNSVNTTHTNADFFETRLDLIISKLEEVRTYKEIPIEKENKIGFYEAQKIRKEEAGLYYPPTQPETSYHCPECGEKMWGTSGLPIKKCDSKPCNECQQISANIKIKKPVFPSNYFVKNGEIVQEIKPKSFKFDISFLTKIEFNQNRASLRSYPSASFAIEGRQIDFHSDNPKNFPESFNGKTYTIEIKEKI